jgi:hypothetical protein
MTYHIMKVTLVRTIDGHVTDRFSWLTDTHVTDIEAYRQALKEQYQCQRAALVFEEINQIVKV